MKEIQEAIEKFIHDYGDQDAMFLDELFDILSLVAEKQVVDDGIKEATQNALYATGKFSELQCEELSEGIFQYIKDHYKVFPLITETLKDKP